MIQRHEIWDATGTLIELRIADSAAGTLTITAGGTVNVVALDPATIAEMEATSREEQQEQRLRTNFQTLRNVPPAASLTNAQLRDEVDLLRAMLLDLTRVVRGIAAE